MTTKDKKEQLEDLFSGKFKGILGVLSVLEYETVQQELETINRKNENGWSFSYLEPGYLELIFNSTNVPKCQIIPVARDKTKTDDYPSYSFDGSVWSEIRTRRRGIVVTRTRPHSPGEIPIVCSNNSAVGFFILFEDTNLGISRTEWAELGDRWRKYQKYAETLPPEEGYQENKSVFLLNPKLLNSNYTYRLFGWDDKSVIIDLSDNSLNDPRFMLELEDRLFVRILWKK